MAKVHIGLQEVIALVPLPARPDDLLILGEYLVDRDDEILKDGPVLVIGIILHLLLECFDDLALLY